VWSSSCGCAICLLVKDDWKCLKYKRARDREEEPVVEPFRKLKELDTNSFNNPLELEE
jgi:hypothetical protein